MQAHIQKRQNGCMCHENLIEGTGSRRGPAFVGRGTLAAEYMDNIIRLFIDAHPQFASEAWRVAPGRYMIRGRDVQMLGENRTFAKAEA